jgi:carbamoyltransferase
MVIAGGVALNSVVNGRLLRDTRFKNIYVMPGAGDNGTCIGAAYYLYNGILQNSKRAHHDNAFIGTEYPNDHIQTVLDECKLNYYKSAHVCKDTAKLLYKGKIVGWFQGRMEFGPRSLGNRSILANPTINEMKDKINAEVKHREPYRPFAPSILSEKCSEYFDIDVASPFMLKVCDVKEDKQHIIPAITHVDGTARLQTVHSNTNSRYYELIEEFGKLSGVPVILNTSFNIMGESIVENPIAAIHCFFSTGLDSLVIGDYIINKNDNTFTNEGTLSC